MSSQPSPAPVRAHWLVGAALRAGYEQVEDLQVTLATPVDVAWSAVAAACGLDEDGLAALVAESFHVELADLSRVTPMAVRLMPARVARKHRIMPVSSRERQIVVATADPTDLVAEQAVGFLSGRTPVLKIAPPTALARAIEAAYGPGETVRDRPAEVAPAPTDPVHLEPQTGEPPPSPAEDQADGPVVRLVSIIFHQADALGASDVHIQPGGAGGVVRFRVDGVLQHGMEMPAPVLQRIISRIKIMARLDIADRLRPQDGRATIAVAERRYDLRISTVPTQRMEKAVIRLLPVDRKFSLDDVGMHPDERRVFARMIGHREGIVLVTGPTGSGKTTTLYGALHQIATDDVNVMTVEDPVEYEVQGLTQIQVETRQDVTFASALRAILRQDPDVIFVGEIRDAETAAMAAQASLTGHLVLSTLHTNDASGAVRRLLDLGLDASTVADTLRGVVAQRLVRTVCPECCRAPGDGEPRGDHVVPVGCPKCGGTGFRGRRPLMELLEVTPAVQGLIARGAGHEELVREARAAGMNTLRAAGERRVQAGETTSEEVERVLGEVAEPEPVSRAPGADAPRGPLPDGGPTGSRDTSATPARAPGPSAAHTGGTAPAPHSAQNGAGAPPAAPARNGDPGSALAALQVPEGTEAPTVLVVDDDPASRLLSAALLERAGYRVTEAGNGAEGLDRLQSDERFALAVLDLDMPDMNGREVLQRIRAADRTSTLPVIVLTGDPDPAADVELMELGADDYLRKPVDPYRLLTRVRATLRRRAWDAAETV